MKLKKQDIAKLKKHNRVRTKMDRDNNGKEKTDLATHIKTKRKKQEQNKKGSVEGNHHSSHHR